MTHRAPIEQAVFTSARSRQRDGYHLVATSPGVTREDAHELATWGPTHDSLCDHCPASGSINFHRLPSGNCCVSRTVASGSEYSNRGSRRIYTQCLVVPPGVMARFANNPFRLIEAASASGRLDVFDDVPPQLESFRLVGRASPFDGESLRWLASEIGPRSAAALVQAAMSTHVLGILGASSSERLFSALITLFPPSCRSEFSLSTGLRYSPRRPFRVIALEDDAGLVRRLGQRTDAVLFDMSGIRPESFPRFGPWVEIVLEALQTEQWNRLAQWYAEIGDDVMMDGLDRFAVQRKSSASFGHRSQPEHQSRRHHRLATCRPDGGDTGHGSEDRGSPTKSAPPRRPSQGAPSGRAAALTTSEILDRGQAALMEKLEQLDGAVLDAINGREGARERIQKLWPDLVSQLSPPLVDESRQQFVQFAVREWLDVCERAAPDPARAVAVLDVLALLFEPDLSHEP